MKWNTRTENTIAAAEIRPRPAPPLQEIPAGPPHVLPAEALTAEDINIINMRLNYRTVATNLEADAY